MSGRVESGRLVEVFGGQKAHRGDGMGLRARATLLSACGGVPLRVVFDRPGTVVIGFEDERRIWNGTPAKVAIHHGFTIELCAAPVPKQKGAW